MTDSHILDAPIVGARYQAMTVADAIVLGERWVERGIPVGPVALAWDPAAGKISKRPLTRNGHLDFTTDIARLTALFNGATLKAGEEVGVGLCPGPAGWWICDLDITEEGDGRDTLHDLESEQGDLPIHPIARTPSGGEHRYLPKRPGQHVSNSHGFGTGIDVRGDSGWVVAPGTTCSWGAWVMTNDAVAVPDHSDMPEWVYEKLGTTSNGQHGPRGPWAALDEATLNHADKMALEALTRLGGHGAYRVSDGSSIMVTRPGKTAGTSASISYLGPGLVKVFTSSWHPLRQNVVYDADRLNEIANAVEAGETKSATSLADPASQVEMAAIGNKRHIRNALTRDVTDVTDVSDTPRQAKGCDDFADEPGDLILDAVRDFMANHVAYSSEHYAATVALWCAHTHALDHAASTPRIAFESPEPESGKSRNLELMECVCRNGRLVLQMSPASIYRWVAASHPTILLDEIDAVFGARANNNHEDLRALINAGHRPGASVPRVDPNTMEVVEFPCYAPVALAGLTGTLPDTVRSRSIRIPMRRRAPDETVRPFRERTTRPEGEALQRRLAAWVSHHGAEIPEEPSMPDGVTDRQADQWEPLIAIADAAGGHWPETARKACVAIVTEARGNVDEQSLGIRLLSDIDDAFDGADVMSTADILKKLHAMDDAPWGELRGHAIDARWLARKLKPYGAASRTVRIGGSTVKGYHSEDLHEAWTRYVHPVRNKRHKGNTPGRGVSDVTDVTHNEEVTGDGAGRCSICDGTESDHEGALHCWQLAK